MFAGGGELSRGKVDIGLKHQGVGELEPPKRGARLRSHEVFKLGRLRDILVDRVRKFTPLLSEAPEPGMRISDPKTQIQISRGSLDHLFQRCKFREDTGAGLRKFAALQAQDGKVVLAKSELAAPARSPRVESQKRKGGLVVAPPPFGGAP